VGWDKGKDLNAEEGWGGKQEKQYGRTPEKKKREINYKPGRAPVAQKKPRKRVKRGKSTGN